MGALAIAVSPLPCPALPCAGTRWKTHARKVVSGLSGPLMAADVFIDNECY